MLPLSPRQRQLGPVSADRISVNRRRFLGTLAATAAGSLEILSAGCSPLVAAGEASPDSPVDRSQLDPLGGHWFVTKREPHAYYYRDGERFLNLFAPANHDVNKDGIPDLALSHDEEFLIMDTQGYPNHPTAIFPNASNPNRILPQKFRFKLPFRPQLAETITRLPMGPVGVAINGVVFFNPFEAGGINAVEGYSEVWLDACCGHPQQEGVYHYHKYPTCVKSPFRDDGQQHSPVIGFAFDGFPLYGPYEGSRQFARDLTGAQALDVCNGHRDPERGYHYHVTPGRFPYITGGYAGVPVKANSRELTMRAQSGAAPNNASGKSTLGSAIESVTPGNLVRGSVHTVRICLSRDAAKWFFVPKTSPDWVQFGPYAATSAVRSGDVIEARVTLPPDATLGIFLDCHLEFAPARGSGLPIVIKKNDAIRIVNENKPAAAKNKP